MLTFENKCQMSFDDDDDGSLPEGSSLAFTPLGDEMSEVVSQSLPHRQLWVSSLSYAVV